MLHHVVALECAVHQHVEADLLLPGHVAGGLLAQEGLVLGVAHQRRTIPGRA